MYSLSELQSDAKRVYQVGGVALYELAKKYDVKTQTILSLRAMEADGETPNIVAAISPKNTTAATRSATFAAIKAAERTMI